MRAYLDIETTYEGDISVVGIHRPGRPLIQLVGGEITDVNLEKVMEGIDVLVTFNGSRFDLPVIRKTAGIDLTDLARHRDLLTVCRRRGIKGGLKRIEVLFGIPRLSEMIDGAMAPYLWQRYQEMGDEEALEELLAYNREDVVNLEILEMALDALEPLE
ncbi:MAG: ribonuclease H-like domain-containing protein [bacterium]|nr:MAG: ribonuclease H-like domain-containing protein [bacterium]